MRHTYKSLTLTDNEVIGMVRKFVNDTASCSFRSGTISLFNSGIQISLDQTFEGNFIQSFTFQLGVGDLILNLTIARDGIWLALDLQFSRQNGSLNHLEVTQIVSWFYMNLAPISSVDYIKATANKEVAEYYNAREESLQRIESISLKITENYEKYRSQVEQDNLAYRKTVDAELEKRIQAMEAEFLDRKKAVDLEKSEIEKLKAQFDDRSNMHARRGLHDKLLATIKERYRKFSISEETIRKRRLLHVLFCGLIGSLLLFVVLSILNLNGSVEGYLKFSLSTLGFGATLIYYIRWNDSWFRKHADEEFNMKRFELDFERANWLVEMAMEWKMQKDSDIPQSLLDRLSDNLFQSKTGEIVRHPTEDVLAQLFAALAALNIALPGGSSISLDKSAVKELGKAVASKSD